MSQPLRDTTNKTPVRMMGNLSIRCPGSEGRMTFRQNSNGNNLKGLRKREVTPTRNASLINNSAVIGDRFVNLRRTEAELELANHLLSQTTDNVLNTSRSAPNSPQKASQQEELLRMMRGSKSSGNILEFADEDRILVYKKNCAPAPAVGHMSQAKILYSANVAHPSSSVKKSSRFIPQQPERILDAPEFHDDYYSNLIDWSNSGIVAVVLGFTLYLWNSSSGDIQQLFDLDPATNEQPTSVKWCKDGINIAVGFQDGSVRIYDPERRQPTNRRLELRTMKVPLVGKCGTLAWRNSVVSAGYFSGDVVHHDVRVAQHITGSFKGHTRDIVGLHWSYDEKMLATGSCDQTARIWHESKMGQRDCEDSIFTFDEHIGGVRAVQFCNFKSSVLATGGGMQDMTVRLWNVHTGENTKCLRTDSAVNAIVFNRDYCEMVTAHSSGKLNIWKYPSCSLTATLSGHEPQRATSCLASPCGQYIISVGGDETIRMWQPFKVDKSTAKLAQQRKLMNHSVR